MRKSWCGQAKVLASRVAPTGRSKASAKRDPRGRELANVCLGCDAFFETHLKTEIEALRARRLARAD